jgi:hypothetical protein
MLSVLVGLIWMGVFDPFFKDKEALKIGVVFQKVSGVVSGVRVRQLELVVTVNFKVVVPPHPLDDSLGAVPFSDCGDLEGKAFE